MLALFLKELLMVVLVVVVLRWLFPPVSRTPKIMMLFSSPPSLHVLELWPLLPHCEHVRDKDIFFAFLLTQQKNNNAQINPCKEHNLERDYIFIYDVKKRERSGRVFLSLVFHLRER